VITDTSIDTEEIENFGCFTRVKGQVDYTANL